MARAADARGEPAGRGTGCGYGERARQRSGETGTPGGSTCRAGDVLAGSTIDWPDPHIEGSVQAAVWPFGSPLHVRRPERNVGKQGRRSQRVAARAELAHRADPPDRRLQLGVAIGVVVILVAGLAAAAISFAAGLSTSNPNSLPQGTQVFAENDHTHVTGTVNYDHVPPAGGPHNATPLNCGIYNQVVPNEYAVHSLEHGAVWITYQPTLSADQVATLTQVVTSNYLGSEKYVILSPYLGLPAPIVATAWGAQLSVNGPGDSRLVQFIHHFAGGAQGGEQGGPCTGGVGNPIG
jgi:hypothetical protein